MLRMRGMFLRLRDRQGWLAFIADTGHRPAFARGLPVSVNRRLARLSAASAYRTR
jgi:hypothetical protein